MVYEPFSKLLNRIKCLLELGNCYTYRCSEHCRTRSNIPINMIDIFSKKKKMNYAVVFPINKMISLANETNI